MTSTKLNRYKKTIAFAISMVLIVVLILPLSACGGGGASNTSTTGGDSTEVKELRVATGIGGRELFDVTEDGEPTGYEYELLKLIDERIPEYTFKYEPITMPTQLTEIASGRIDIGSHDYEDNPERRQNYLFADTPHWSSEQVFFVKGDNKSINSFEDLIGKTIVTLQGGNSAYALEQWNIDHPDQQLIIDAVASLDILAADLNTGKADAVLFDTLSTSYFKVLGIESVRQVTTEPFVLTGVYFIFPKDRTDVKAAVDKALVELDNEGAIEALANSVLVNDFEDTHYAAKTNRDAIVPKA